MTASHYVLAEREFGLIINDYYYSQKYKLSFQNFHFPVLYMQNKSPHCENHTACKTGKIHVQKDQIENNSQ